MTTEQQVMPVAAENSQATSMREMLTAASVLLDQDRFVQTCWEQTAADMKELLQDALALDLIAEDELESAEQHRSAFIAILNKAMNNCAELHDSLHDKLRRTSPHGSACDSGCRTAGPWRIHSTGLVEVDTRTGWQAVQLSLLRGDSRGIDTDLVGKLAEALRVENS